MGNKQIPSHASPGLVDYSQGAFIKTYVEDDAIYYAAFHPEFYNDEEGLDQTGRYFVVLLSPSGMYQLYLVLREGRWEIDHVDKNLQLIDSFLDRVLDAENTGNKNFPEEKNYLVEISTERFEWMSQCLAEHLG